MVEGPERKRLEKLFADHKLENIITLHGFQANPHPFVSAADWFVCSSHTEGYSMVVAEALTLGVPVLATRCADMDEHLGGNNEWGIIVDNNELALLDGMRKVLQDRELTVNYRKWAARRGGHYSLDKRMEEIMGLIEQ